MCLEGSRARKQAGMTHKQMVDLLLDEWRRMHEENQRLKRTIAELESMLLEGPDEP